MLVLTRKTQEAIHIGDNVVVTVVSVRGNKVRIGIEAPEGVRIWRDDTVDLRAKHPRPVGGREAA